MISVIDLFSGAGGLSLGFNMLETIQIKAAAEIDKNARDTFYTNHSLSAPEMYDDVKKIDYEKLKQRLGEIDIVISGPPCQGFSNANRQRNTIISSNNI